MNKTLCIFPLIAASLAGCVERKISIASDPPGALVYVNGVEAGRAPLTIPFLWYGDYEITASLDKNVGTLDAPKIIQYSYHGSRTAAAPAYEWIGVDLFAELLPVRLVDQKIWAVKLEPAAQPSDDQLINSGRDLHEQLDTDPALKRPREVKAPPGKTPATQPAPPATAPAH